MTAMIRTFKKLPEWAQAISLAAGLIGFGGAAVVVVGGFIGLPDRVAELEVFVPDSIRHVAQELQVLGVRADNASVERESYGQELRVLLCREIQMDRGLDPSGCMTFLQGRVQDFLPPRDGGAVP